MNFTRPRPKATSEALRNHKGPEGPRPDFVSINSTAGVPVQHRGLSGVIKEKLGLEVMAHLTCIGHTRAQIAEIAARRKGMKIENVLALRGDLHNIDGLRPRGSINTPRSWPASWRP